MRIKYSKRGLTFSFRENETFRAGTKYRYILDTKDASIILVPDNAGKYKLSQKGEDRKPLVDLRNKEIKEAISLADYMEIEITDEKIVVHVVKKKINSQGLSDREVVELLDKEEKETFVLHKEDFITHNEDIYNALVNAGFLSAKQCKDVSYIFDVVSLFSGAGMLDYPFHKDASFAIKMAVDFDKSACETYKNMIGDHILCIDMRELKEDMVPDADLIIGGPYCQGYSNANRALTGKEEAKRKRKLVDDYIRIVKAKKPLVFLIENVPQFVTKDNGEHLQSVLTELSDYKITYQIVNDNEVGGYSTRKRMLLIGSRIGEINIPNVELYRKMTCGDALRKVNPTWVHFTDLTKADKETQRKMAYVKDGENYKAIPELSTLDRHSNVYRRLREDEPAVTITNWRKILMMPPVRFLEKDADGKRVQRQLNCAEAIMKGSITR